MGCTGKWRRMLAAVSAAFLPLVGYGVASAQIILTSDISEVCKAPALTARETIVYIDLASIDPDNHEWGLTILNRLALRPRERLTVLAGNPSDFSVKESFNLCFPTLADDEIRSIKTERGYLDWLLSQDPEAQQEDNIETFRTRLGNALDEIRNAAAEFHPGDAKRRNILGTIALDRNRFSESAAYYRVIIYTHGLIVDPAIEGLAEPDEAVAELQERYPMNLDGADIQIFGVQVGAEEEADIGDRERVFRAFFLQSWGHLRSFGVALPQQSTSDVGPISHVDGEFEGGGASGRVRLEYAISNGRDLTGSWLIFEIPRGPLRVPIGGEVLCDDAEKCELAGAVLAHVPLLAPEPFFRTGDRLELSGPNDEWSGVLEPAAAEVFAGMEGQGRSSVRYELRFGTGAEPAE